MICSCCRKRPKPKDQETQCVKEIQATKTKVLESDYTFSESNSTLIKSPNSLPQGYPIFVVDSTNSNFFILDRSVQATVEALQDCNIILGPTDSSVFIRDCRQVTIIAYCQQFRVRDCSNLNVFLYSTTEPVIETSFNIIFHPNTLKYNGLETLLSQSDLKDKPNKWNMIYDFNDKWPKNYSISNDSCILNVSKLKDFEAIFQSDSES